MHILVQFICKWQFRSNHGMRLFNSCSEMFITEAISCLLFPVSSRSFAMFAICAFCVLICSFAC